MMLPRPEVTEHLPEELPTEFRCASAFAPLMAAWAPRQAEAGRASPARDRLQRFQRLMAAEGWPVQVDRMLDDPVYARERLGLALGRGRGALRQLAVQLWPQRAADLH
ncbi:MAG: hypothetical protein L6Q75_02145 [Burkholderiaceae bacterium]|nr:hypothetical protein [Burkholderiaceae bacterium]